MAEMVKGFGCRQAYESPSCRNPRSAYSGLWDFVFQGGPWAVGHSRVRRTKRVEEGACSHDCGDFCSASERVFKAESYRHSA